MAAQGSNPQRNTSRKEFGLTQDEIVQAIRAGKLHYPRNSVFGKPFLRLLRREVEALVKKKHGDNYLKDQKAKTGLAHNQPRAEAAEDPDSRVGRAEVKADGRPREMTASALLSNEERER